VPSAPSGASGSASGGASRSRCSGHPRSPKAQTTPGTGTLQNRSPLARNGNTASRSPVAPRSTTAWHESTSAAGTATAQARYQAQVKKGLLKPDRVSNWSQASGPRSSAWASGTRAAAADRTVAIVMWYGPPERGNQHRKPDPCRLGTLATAPRRASAVPRRHALAQHRRAGAVMRRGHATRWRRFCPASSPVADEPHRPTNVVTTMTHHNSSAPLRLLLVTNGNTIPTWLRKCVEDVEQSGVATFVLVLRAAPEGAPGPFRFLQGLRRFLFWLYKNVDRRLFRSSPDAHAPIDLRSAL